MPRAIVHECHDVNRKRQRLVCGVLQDGIAETQQDIMPSEHDKLRD